MPKTGTFSHFDSEPFSDGWHKPHTQIFEKMTNTCMYIHLESPKKLVAKFQKTCNKEMRRTFVTIIANFGRKDRVCTEFLHQSSGFSGQFQLSSLGFQDFGPWSFIVSQDLFMAFQEKQTTRTNSHQLKFYISHCLEDSSSKSSKETNSSYRDQNVRKQD